MTTITTLAIIMATLSTTSMSAHLCQKYARLLVMYHAFAVTNTLVAAAEAERQCNKIERLMSLVFPVNITAVIMFLTEVLFPIGGLS